MASARAWQVSACGSNQCGCAHNTATGVSQKVRERLMSGTETICGDGSTAVSVDHVEDLRQRAPRGPPGW